MSARSDGQPPKPKITPGSLALGFVFCVLFPGFVTAIAPVSWVPFERTGEVISATTKTGGFVSLLTVLSLVGLIMLVFQFARKTVGFGVKGSAE